jgi:hypothetical protein
MAVIGELVQSSADFPAIRLLAAFLCHRPDHRQTAATTARRGRMQLVEQRGQHLRRGQPVGIE